MFSPLQRYILNECFRQKGNKINREVFESFYLTSSIKKTLRVKIITQSLERLIDRGLLTGYGVRTPKKWFIKEVKLTPLGSREWKKFLARRQQKLPI